MIEETNESGGSLPLTLPDESQGDSQAMLQPRLTSSLLDSTPTEAPQANVLPAIQTSLEQPSIQTSLELPSIPSIQPPPHQPLSRDSTLTSSSSFTSENSGDATDLKLNRIFSLLQEIFHERCRICWVEKTRTHPHGTFRCPRALCSGSEWNSFKTNLRFPAGKVCYFCMVPYCAPFNHERPLPGTSRTPDLCYFPDVLKELSYILYAKRLLRQKIFQRLGLSMPLTLEAYKRYIARRPNGGIFGAYEVIYAYLEVREEETGLDQ